jgi:hypothetical protein
MYAIPFNLTHFIKESYLQNPGDFKNAVIETVDNSPKEVGINELAF